MSSILTNNAATTALRVLESVQSAMDTTQNQISTGKKVANAREGAATWGISKAMEADIEGFKRVTQNLAMAESTVAVALRGSETITDLMTQIKSLVVEAQAENVDRTKIQEGINDLATQIADVVVSASLNGQNLLQNETGSDVMQTLIGLNRQADGSVDPQVMQIQKRDMTTRSSSISAAGGTYSTLDTATIQGTGALTGSIDLSGTNVSAGEVYAIAVVATTSDATFDPNQYSSASASLTQAQMAISDMTYVARQGDNLADVMEALETEWREFASGRELDSEIVDLTFSDTGITLAMDASYTGTATQIDLEVYGLTANAGSTAGGGFEKLGTLDVTTGANAREALVTIDSLIEKSVEESTNIAYDIQRLDRQSDFVSTLTDALQAGIGALVDADMETASARLEALRVQEQLAIQGLSIANSSPNVLLSLFR